jgi:amino acid transporter
MAVPAVPSAPTFQRALTFFDVTNITVGAIVGADIYVASTITAGILGPASLLAWAAAAVLAAVLALCLAECARLVPAVGGPFAYVTRAFGRFPGFLAGWSMWVAELTALPVFAIAFTNYLGAFVALPDFAVHGIRLLFLGVLTGVNVLSVRAAGRLNDALTLLKLSPLLLMLVAGIVYVALHLPVAVDNLTPFAPYGFAPFPRALVLVVWAYMGFELSTVPAGEVREPERTIPRALMTGIAIVALFYLATNFVVYALTGYEQLARTATPLVATGMVLFGGVGATIMAAGAMVSVSGSNESDMLGSSRLAYAMAADGLLPHRLAAIHARFRTPYVALVVQGAMAMALTAFDGVARLISFAVFNLSFAFLLCALALLRLQRGEHAARGVRRVIAPAAVVVAAGLLLATATADKVAGAGVLLAGVAVYLLAAPQAEVPEAAALLTDEERALQRLAHRRMRFLGGLVGWLGGRRTPPRPPRHEERAHGV